MQNGTSISRDERIHMLVKGGLSEERAEQKVKEEEERSAARRSAVSPLGALRLPLLLDKKRVEYEIPDELFSYQAATDRIFIFQIEDTQLKGTTLALPETTQHLSRVLSPRGIIISAGFSALDSLRSNGIDVGHTVIFNQMTPYRFQVGYVAGAIREFCICRAGEVCGSEELATSLRIGDSRIDCRTGKTESGDEYVYHILVDENGKEWRPEMPWVADDA